MENMNLFKAEVLGAFGLIGAFISTLFGGWDSALTTLVICMAVDFITGWIVAAVFKKSAKSECGGLESKAGWKGLCKKGMMLGVVLISAQLDIVAGTTFVKDAVVIGFIANEALSIIENAGLMGVPIPAVITRAIDVLKNKADK